MKSKTILTMTLLAVFTIVAAIPSSSWAGSPQSHRWEGVAIGVGAAIIGSAILKNMHQNYSAADREPQPAEVHHYHHRPPRPTGYWDVQKEWVPPVYEKVWNPGHYDRHGRWINGRWIRIESQPGYWTEQRVWVPYE